MGKKLIKIAVGALAFLFILSSPFIIVIQINNIRLNNFAEQLFLHQLPPRTEIVTTYKEAGNTNGTGDNFGFWVYIVISTDLSEQEIEDYYSKANFKGGKYLRVDVIPYNLARTTISRTYSRTTETGIQTDNRYIIQLYNHDDSILGILDIRRS